MIAATLKMSAAGSALGILFLTACGSTEPAAPSSDSSTVEASASRGDVPPVVGYWALDMAATITAYEAVLADRPEGDSKDEALAEFEMNKLLFDGVQQHYNINRDGSVVVQTTKPEDESFDFEASSGTWAILESGELRIISPTRVFKGSLDGDKLSLKRTDRDLAPAWILNRVQTQN
ncbi:MAG: hypothetical protein ACYTG5_03120 [Planctomycetota bacterium]|jgi:hypothetical protein